MIPIAPQPRSRRLYLTWHGDKLTYGRLHQAVYKLRGKPQRCERCGTTDPAKHYDWANLTGRYEDPADYQRMCKSCHRRYDLARHCEGGLSTAEAAARLGVSRPGVGQLIKAGQIEAQRINPATQSAWRIDEQSVADYLQRRAS
jgi:excisionase family DNA binding protein